MIERAIHLGANLDVDSDLFRPPYASTWPRIPSEQELEALAPRDHDRTRDRWDPAHARDDIRTSVTWGDFASYVIGTNSGRSDWLSMELSGEPWRSPTERMAALEASLSQSEQEAFSGLRAAERDAPQPTLRFDPDGGRRDWAYVASGESGEEVTEREYEEAQARVEVVRSRFVASLTEEQVTEYLSIRETSSGDEPRFDPSIIQRYVLWRVFDLGWTAERFGEFDQMAGSGYGRNADKAERIGKKYQWIAYHEILAYISDHYQYREQYRYDGSADPYRGPWQIHRRDIDPSCALPAIVGGNSPREDNAVWWEGSTYSDWRQHLDDRAWLDQSDDFPDPKEIVRVVKTHDDDRWVNVQAMPAWRQPVPPEHESSDVDHRQVWLHATAHFVAAGDTSEFLEWSKRVAFWGGWMPRPEPASQLFLGEHGWSPAFMDTLGATDSAYVPESRDGIVCPIELRAAAFEYYGRCGGYDCSAREERTFYVPSPEFIQAMGLRLSGAGGDFVDSEGRLAAFDPTVQQSGPPGLLLREDLLADYLEQSGLALVWSVAGEKEAFSAGWSSSWNGSRRFSGAYRYTPSGIEGALSHQLQLPPPGNDR